ncbi:hypothetical protein K431DRAFT_280076 [Polychaeton citri CBS 116435]|uniref:Small ribosomal subunit protein uS9m n=1 Tax=Polychaeton citri CBS 116435 TaxID=1314669 RepID=A0A9P4QI80_9PEZI|nr:hypothetical protein K431DRAFT_280076 [Polychaeton citri CBS 116435]
MEPLSRASLRKGLAAAASPARRRIHLPYHTKRFYATPTESSNGQQQDEIKAAPPIEFSDDANQFVNVRAIPGKRRDDYSGEAKLGKDGDPEEDPFVAVMKSIRVVPASPSYFTATPHYTDNLLELSALLRRYQILPKSAPGLAPRVAWKTFAQYKTEVGEPVKAARYTKILTLLKRLNYIHPSLMPKEVSRVLDRYKRLVQPHLNQPKPIVVDEHGKSRAVGKRKSSSAVVYVVEGEGECMINGRTIADYFSRLHDRESAVWALKATQRVDKYNVWAIVKGGGTTGQAEAITLGVAKALLAHEPDLKPALRRAGCITRDPRRVERKKPGKLKARKMPAWVKR